MDNDVVPGHEPVLVRTKLVVPRLPASFVDRPRVTECLLNVLRSNRVVMLTATAGSGKTTALAGLVGHVDSDVCWLTVDRSDRAPGRLAIYLAAALATHRPSVAEITRRALAMGVSHRETIAAAVESIGDEPLVLILDEVDQLGDNEDAWSVLDAVFRFAPPSLRILLSSRSAGHAFIGTAQPSTVSAASWESELAFTAGEAFDALAALGKNDVSPELAVEATGGWVTGVLFEAWRSGGHVDGAGGESDSLHGYLSTQILDNLEQIDCDFLIRTAVLDGVDRERARRLGFVDAGARLAALRQAHLPAGWNADGTVLRHHTRFREFLLTRLYELDDEVVQDLMRGKASVLRSEGLFEEAAETLLECGLSVEAFDDAERAVLDVADRLDLKVVDRWLAAIEPLPSVSNLTVARLMAAVARDDFAGCVCVADQLSSSGAHLTLAASNSRAAALMSWAYLLSGRTDDAVELLDCARGPEVASIRYAMRLWIDDADADAAVPFTGTPLDAIALITQYFSGRLRDVARTSLSPWTREVTGLFEAAALCAAGRMDEAVELYESLIVQRGPERTEFTHAVIGAEILLDAGRVDEAEKIVREGLSAARAAGVRVFEIALRLTEIRIVIRQQRSVEGARLVERLRMDPLCASIVYFREVLDATDGFLQLQREAPDWGDDPSRQALILLRGAVAGMRRGGRILMLPAAAVYLSEAEWRMGNVDEADTAMNIALEATVAQGSNNAMLQALSNFPAVLSRRTDSESEADSVWHSLGRALILQDRLHAPKAESAPVHLVEFGADQGLLRHSGLEVRPSISKASELLAYLLAHGGTVSRKSLLQDLFDGRQDDAAQAYLRQALRRLREVLPDPEVVRFEGTFVKVGANVRITSDSVRFENKVGEAARLRGADRMAALDSTLEVYNRGGYLDMVGSQWVDSRRIRLEELATDARLEAAALCLEFGRFQHADDLVRSALESDPYREAGWRLAMTIADARGNGDSVVPLFRRCGQALAGIGLTPAPATRELLQQLRR